MLYDLNLEKMRSALSLAWTAVAQQPPKKERKTVRDASQSRAVWPAVSKSLPPASSVKSRRSVVDKTTAAPASKQAS